MQRIPTLYGWRGIAIALVLAEHFSPRRDSHAYFSWLYMLGQHGVTVFFVLSGFLITSKLLAESQATGRISLFRFYLRRFFRLAPCSWCYLLVVALCLGHLNLLWPHELRACLFFYRNYFGGNVISPTAHFWSLSLEEQFYVAWPPLLLAAGQLRARWLLIAALTIVMTRVASPLLRLPDGHTSTC